MNKKPNLILMALFWSFVLALVMTLIGFLHQEPVDLTDAAAGGIVWARVLYLFLGWFLFSAIVMSVGALLYLGSARMRKRGGRRG
jgi:hypothetical protein